jgi:hypothetical protein
MAESETSRALHNGRLTPKAIGAPLGGPSRDEKVAPTPTPIAPHGRSLQYIISIIKNSQPRSPAQENE